MAKDPGAYTPIAVGFYLLGVPLWAVAAWSESHAGAVANGIVGTLLVLIGAAIQWRSRCPGPPS